MSASTQEQTNGQTQKAPRKARAKSKARTGTPRKTVGAPAGVSSIRPTPERQVAMSARAAAIAGSPNIAAGYAAELATAGPGWSAEYQKQFLAGLTNSLPVICAPKGTQTTISKAAA